MKKLWTRRATLERFALEALSDQYAFELANAKRPPDDGALSRGFDQEQRFTATVARTAQKLIARKHQIPENLEALVKKALNGYIHPG